MAIVFGLMLTMEGCMISLTMLLCVCSHRNPAEGIKNLSFGESQGII